MNSVAAVKWTGGSVITMESEGLVRQNLDNKFSGTVSAVFCTYLGWVETAADRDCMLVGTVVVVAAPVHAQEHSHTVFHSW